MTVYTPNQFASDVLAATADAVEKELPPEELQATVAELVAKFTAPGEPVIKVDEDQHMVWGWASVAVEKGQPVYDLQGDVIDMGDLQNAVHQFMADERVSKEMHRGPVRGTVVDSIVFTKAVQDALGINLGREGWYVGVHVDDPTTWERVKKGELKAFSIGGSGEREPIDKEWSDAAREAAAEARRERSDHPFDRAEAATHSLNERLYARASHMSQYRESYKRQGKLRKARAHFDAAHTSRQRAVDAAFAGDHEGAARHAAEGHGHLDNLDALMGDVKKAGESASDYAYVPDASKPSTWKLCISDAAHVSAAAAALGPGFRGEKVQIPASALPGVKAKVRAAWRRFYPDKDPSDMPSGIAKGAWTVGEILHTVAKDWSPQAREAAAEARRKLAARHAPKATDHAITLSARAQERPTVGTHMDAAKAHDEAAELHRVGGEKKMFAWHKFTAQVHRSAASEAGYNAMARLHQAGVGKAAQPTPEELAQAARDAQTPLPHAPGTEKMRAQMIAAHAKTHAHLTTEQSAALLKPRSKIPLSADEMEAHRTAHLAAGGKRDKAAQEAEEQKELQDRQRLGLEKARTFGEVRKAWSDAARQAAAETRRRNAQYQREDREQEKQLRATNEPYRIAQDARDYAHARTGSGEATNHQQRVAALRSGEAEHLTRLSHAVNAERQPRYHYAAMGAHKEAAAQHLRAGNQEHADAHIRAAAIHRAAAKAGGISNYKQYMSAVRARP